MIPIYTSLKFILTDHFKESSSLKLREKGLHEKA